MRIFARTSTVDRALAVLQQEFIHLGVAPDRPSGVSTARGEFVGYLMFDALIGNTDRHHENWAVIVIRRDGSNIVEAELAPSFDHASCLGRELDDLTRTRRLSGSPNDPSFEKYYEKMDSRWYLNPGDSKRIHPLKAFATAAEREMDAAAAWRERLDRVTGPLIDNLLAQMPSCMSVPSRLFAKHMILFNLMRLRQEN